jgi:hypothetical protein
MGRWRNAWFIPLCWPWQHQCRVEARPGRPQADNLRVRGPAEFTAS